MISFLPDGKLTIELDEERTVMIRRPTYSQLKAWRLRWAEILSEFTKWGDEHPDLPNVNSTEADAAKAFEDADDDQRRDWGFQRSDRANAQLDAIARGLLPFWHLVIDGDPTTGLKGAGDKPLTGSDDDLPSYLVTSLALLNEVFVHWQTVPLDRGAMGQPAPQTPS